MAPIACSETSVRNYHYTLHSNSKERSYHFFSRRKLEITLWDGVYVMEFSCRRTSFIFSSVMTLQTVVRLAICLDEVARGQISLLATSSLPRQYRSTKAPYLLVFQRLYRQLTMSLPLSCPWQFKLESAFRFTRPNVELKSTCYLTTFCNSFSHSSAI